MNVKAIRSDGVYAKIMSAPAENKNDIYRYARTHRSNKGRRHTKSKY